MWRMTGAQPPSGLFSIGTKGTVDSRADNKPIPISRCKIGTLHRSKYRYKWAALKIFATTCPLWSLCFCPNFTSKPAHCPWITLISVLIEIDSQSSEALVDQAENALIRWVPSPSITNTNVTIEEQYRSWRMLRNTMCTTSLLGT